VEYVAFLFLGLGVLLILAGVLLQAGEKQRSRNSPLEEYAFSKTPTSSILNSSKTAPFPEPAVTRPIDLPTGNPVRAASSPVAPPESHPVPGPFQFTQNEPVYEKPAPAPQPAVAVSVQHSNPRLFEKFAYLYLDSSARNVYDGAGSLAAFDLSEVNGIRRFGRGVFSYDGFGFFFDHASGQERFSLANLKTIGFYPNCIALTFRTNQPVALLFMEETESIRKVLEAFRAPNAT
jgi:hypothetical protein